jgi:hypothetical protein
VGAVTTYEARKHARKEQEMATPEFHLEAIAESAFDLMQGEPIVHKQGYTFANALIAMDSMAKLQGATLSATQLAIVAEMLHERLMEQARASEVCLEDS